MTTTRYSEKTGEVPSRNDDNRLRRTAPANVRPPSPQKLDRIYNEGRRRFPEMNATQEHQKPQFSEDERHRNYDNDTPPTRWARGGPLGGAGRPGFDNGKLDIQNQPDRHAAGGGKCKASGEDCHSSPFSAANNTVRDVNDWQPHQSFVARKGQ
jgi:hypothetical protein